MISELKNIVGAENVLDDQETLELYSGDQSLTQARKPLSRGQGKEHRRGPKSG